MSRISPPMSRVVMDERSTTTQRREIMTRLMVRYKVRPEEVAANEQAIEGVFTQLWERSLPGIRYSFYSVIHDIIHAEAGYGFRFETGLPYLP